jgi:hypothetical protein
MGDTAASSLFVVFRVIAAIGIPTRLQVCLSLDLIKPPFESAATSLPYR